MPILVSEVRCLGVDSHFEGLIMAASEPGKGGYVMQLDSRLASLFAYLESSEGVDRHEFTTTDGRPDVQAARDFAEGMRDQLGEYLNEVVTVEQNVNIVRISLVAVPSHVH